MVQFTPRPIKDNDNISKVSPVKEFFILTAGLAGVLAACYLLLGAALNIVIDRIPHKVEHAAGKLFELKKIKADEELLPVGEEVQSLLDELVGFSDNPGSTYRVHIVKEEMVNALALPGGHIVIFSGLLSELESENELAMVLAHELGHFEHRDHLRGLGRGIVFLVISSTFFGADSGLSNLIGGALSSVDMKFSREQEISADLFALDLIIKKYGHAGGTTDFFKRIDKKREVPEFLTFLLTHPLGAQRVEKLNSAIFDHKYSVGVNTPVSASLQELFPKND